MSTHIGNLLFFCQCAYVKRTRSPEKELRVFPQSVYASTSTVNPDSNSTTNAHRYILRYPRQASLTAQMPYGQKPWKRLTGYPAMSTSSAFSAHSVALVGLLLSCGSYPLHVHCSSEAASCPGPKLTNHSSFYDESGVFLQIQARKKSLHKNLWWLSSVYVYNFGLNRR